MGVGELLEKGRVCRDEGSPQDTQEGFLRKNCLDFMINIEGIYGFLHLTCVRQYTCCPYTRKQQHMRLPMCEEVEKTEHNSIYGLGMPPLYKLLQRQERPGTRTPPFFCIILNKGYLKGCIVKEACLKKNPNRCLLQRPKCKRGVSRKSTIFRRLSLEDKKRWNFSHF